jgi:hypothetical protein
MVVEPGVARRDILGKLAQMTAVAVEIAAGPVKHRQHQSGFGQLDLTVGLLTDLTEEFPGFRTTGQGWCARTGGY